MWILVFLTISYSSFVTVGEHSVLPYTFASEGKCMEYIAGLPSLEKDVRTICLDVSK